MATKPKPKRVSKKTPTAAASKKASATASKKVAVKKVAAKKVPVRKVAKKAPVKNSKNQGNTIPLGYTIGVLGVTDGVASLTIDGVAYPFTDQMGFPVCLVFPIKPKPGRDTEYLKGVLKAARELKQSSQSIRRCATCCNPPSP